ncbi:unnamed protein product [Caenorhabditis bovis]|uniref:Aquaporin n=1 Tax=Caenorhabditis bovis TaxID=2654633 RepID=A0A8S1E936_9PELO|nr:unnamed protein product [Caenorhabditis bovis]
MEYSLFCKCYAEFLGVFIFIFCGTMQANVYDIMQPDGLTHSALTHGFATIVIIFTLGHISGGHFNPVVSWAATLIGKLPIWHLPFYMLSQFSAGFCACLLSACLQRQRDFIVWTPIGDIENAVASSSIRAGYNRRNNSTWQKSIMLTTQLAATSSGATLLNLSNDWWEGIISESITTYFFVTPATFSKRNFFSNPAAPFIIGMMAMVDIFATASITGTAMNPVRALSPNIVAEIVLSSKTIPNNFWTFHYIYWVGPYIGSSVAVITYKFFLSRNGRFVN